MSSSLNVKGMKEKSTAAVVANHQVWPGNLVNPAYTNMSPVAPFNSMNFKALVNPVASTKIKSSVQSIELSNSDSESSNDFPPSNKCKMASTTKNAMAGKQRRFKKMVQVAAKVSSHRKLLDGYPKFSFQDKVACMEISECKKCRVYVGRIAFLPCGHAKFCSKCVTKMRDAAFKRQCPGRCLNKGCLCIVKSWFVLKNVNK